MVSHCGLGVMKLLGSMKEVAASFISVPNEVVIPHHLYPGSFL